MKTPGANLDEIRLGMNDFQKELLQEIWREYLKNGDWPTVRALFSDHGKEEVRKALTPLGGNVVREQSGSQGWSQCNLSLLGALLTKDGVANQVLIAKFFQFQRELYQKEPQKLTATSAEIGTALKLSVEQTALLGQLLWLGNFGGGRGGKDGEWNVNSMPEAADFPEFGDLSAQVDEWVCRFYKADEPVFQDQHKPPRYIAELAPPSVAENSVQSHVTEIKMSLDRLYQKYPDPQKLGFLIMRFADVKPIERIVNVIKTTAKEYGLTIIRADEVEFHADLWGNVRTLLHGCGFGIAIYERIETNEPNANVGLEVGYLMAMNKPVLLLKDKTLPALHADLAGKLYKAFDPHDPEKTIPSHLISWLEDKGIVVTKVV